MLLRSLIHSLPRTQQVPISTNLVQVDLLAQAELEWLNAYNAEVREKLEGMVRETGDEAAVEWLVRETMPLLASAE